MYNFFVISAWFRGHACTPWPSWRKILLTPLSTVPQTGKPFSHVSAYMKYRFICFCQSVILLLASRFASPSVIGSHNYTLYVQFGALQLSSYSMFGFRRFKVAAVGYSCENENEVNRCYAVITCLVYFSRFYRTMLCTARTVLSQDVRPSVCPSVRHTPVFYRNC